MATTRFNLIQWVDDTAAVDRTQFNDAFASLDTLGAGYTQTTGDPAAASADKVGFLHFNTTNDTLFYCDGSDWHQLTASIQGSDGPGNSNDSIISAITPGDVKDAGSSTSLARADHVHEMAAFGAISNLTSSATSSDGAASTFSRSDHVHGIPNGTITDAMLAGGIDGSNLSPGSVTNTELGTNSVNSDELVAGSVTAPKVGNDAVELGTKTTGNYVATIAAGTDISVSGSGSETAAVTISHADTSSLSGFQGGSNNGVVIENITVDGNGHVTTAGTRDLDARFLGISATAADSDELGGVAAANYLRSNQNDTMSGRLTVSTTSANLAGSQTINIVDPDNSNPAGGISFQYGTGGTVVNHGVFRMSNVSIHRFLMLQENNATVADLQVQNLHYNGGSLGTSDLNLKTKVGAVPGLDFVDTLKPFTGYWNSDDAQANHFFLGAQEVEAALAQSGRDPEDYGMVRFNADTDALSMDYIQLIPVLVQAVKDLKVRLEAVEAGS